MTAANQEVRLVSHGWVKRAAPVPDDEIRTAACALLVRVCADGGEERFISEGYHTHDQIVEGIVEIVRRRRRRVSNARTARTNWQQRQRANGRCASCGKKKAPKDERFWNCRRCRLDAADRERRRHAARGRKGRR